MPFQHDRHARRSSRLRLARARGAAAARHSIAEGQARHRRALLGAARGIAGTLRPGRRDVVAVRAPDRAPASAHGGMRGSGAGAAPGHRFRRSCHRALVHRDRRRAGQSRPARGNQPDRPPRHAVPDAAGADRAGRPRHRRSLAFLYASARTTGPGTATMKLAILSRNTRLYSTMRLVAAARARGHRVRVLDPLRCYMRIARDGFALHYGGRELKGFDCVIPRIGAPVTVFGDNPDDTADLLNMLGPPPHVIKLNEGAQGSGVVLAEKPAASQSVIEAFRGLYANFLVQEFVREANGRDIRCFVVGDRVVAAMQREAVPGDFRSNLHRGGTGSRVTLSAAERRTALRAARAMELGIAGVDLLRSARGPLVLEVNASPGLEGIETVTGVDVAAAVIRHVEAALA